MIDYRYLEDRRLARLRRWLHRRADNLWGAALGIASLILMIVYHNLGGMQ